MTTLSRPLRAILSAGAFLLLLSAFLLYPAPVRDSTSAAISYCLSVLAPSLFPFMALSSFAVNSPAAQVLGRPLAPVTRWVFRLPGCCAAPLFMSLIGGYPAGASGVSLLLKREQITLEEARRMMLFCVNPGLAFVVSYLGAGVLGSPRLGWMLFFSVSAASLLMGVLTAFFAPLPEKKQPSPTLDPGGALMRSVTDGARSILVMSACVALFSVLTAILHSCGLFAGAVRLLSRCRVFNPMEWAAVLSFLVEVTGGTGDAARLEVGPVFYAFGLGFGGLCVHMQVLSFFAPGQVRFGRFLLGRAAHGGLAAGIFLVMARLVPGGAVAASGSVGDGSMAVSGSWMGGASLLLMCAAFLLITQGSAGDARQGARGDGPLF